MPLLTEASLEKLSQEIVNRFLTEKVALTDGVVDAAGRENLNPEQIKRVVEATNNALFLHKFNNPEKEASDRMVTFEPACSDAAISRLVGNADQEIKTSMAKTASAMLNVNPGRFNADLHTDLPNTRGELPPLEKAAEAPAPEPRVNRDKMIIRMTKTADELNIQKLAKLHEVTEDLQNLITSFTKLYGPSFEEFEKDAFYLWGDDVVESLGVMRAALHLPPATYDHAAMTKVARVVDTETPAMQQFKTLVQHADEFDRLEKATESVQAKLAEIR